MKKSLLVTLEYPPTVGGIATYTNNLANYLKNDTAVLINGKKNLSTENGQTIYTRPLLFPKFIWPRWVRGLFHIWRIARKEQAKILLIHHLLPMGTVALILRLFTRKNYILFFHGTDIIMTNTTLWKRILSRCIIRHAQSCVANSSFIFKQVVALEKTAEIKTEIIYPTPTKPFLLNRDEEKIDTIVDNLALHGKTVILSVGRIDEGKGFTHITRILPKLLEKIPQLVWVVIGDGPKQIDWWKQVETAQLQSVIRYVGQVPQTELPHYYDIADCFVLLTHTDHNREEGVGTVFLEAMARKIPVIAGRTGGVPDVVHDKENGTLVDVYRGDDLIVKTIVEVLKNTDKTAPQVAVAHQQVLDIYRPEIQFETLRQLLQ